MAGRRRCLVALHDRGWARRSRSDGNRRRRRVAPATSTRPRTRRSCRTPLICEAYQGPGYVVVSGLDGGGLAEAGEVVSDLVGVHVRDEGQGSACELRGLVDVGQGEV